MTETKDIQGNIKKEIAKAPEQTKPGKVFMPLVDIFETDKAITLLADMPGVKNQNLDIDLRENTLTIEGGVEWQKSNDEKIILKEYDIGKYYRQFTLSETIDQSKIDATLKDGVLSLVLPKAEKAAPRKINIKTM